MSRRPGSGSHHWRNQRLTSVALLPLGLWFLAAQAKGGGRALLPLLACGCLLLLPNLPNYARNIGFSGSPLGDAARDTNNAAFGLGDLGEWGAQPGHQPRDQNSDYDK